MSPIHTNIGSDESIHDDDDDQSVVAIGAPDERDAKNSIDTTAIAISVKPTHVPVDMNRQSKANSVSRSSNCSMFSA